MVISMNQDSLDAFNELKLFCNDIKLMRSTDERTYYERFGILMTCARKAASITQSDLANHLMISQKKVSRIESAHEPPSAYLMTQISTYLFDIVDSNNLWETVKTNVTAMMAERDL